MDAFSRRSLGAVVATAFVCVAAGCAHSPPSPDVAGGAVPELYAGRPVACRSPAARTNSASRAGPATRLCRSGSASCACSSATTPARDHFERAAQESPRWFARAHANLRVAEARLAEERARGGTR
jgi:hypothetical protein